MVVHFIFSNQILEEKFAVQSDNLIYIKILYISSKVSGVYWFMKSLWSYILSACNNLKPQL
jgi:hypothetical protein